MAGVIDILGTSLYSSRTTPVRELLQNAHDAIVRRRARDLDFQGRIEITLDHGARTLVVEDDGVGLTEDEAETYLGTVGIGLTGMTKQRAGGGETGLIGQFGVGLLSSFLLAERIVVESSRGDGSSAPVCWTAGHGTDIEISPGSLESAGTRVTLHLKREGSEALPDAERLTEVVRHYAEFLPVPIHVQGRPEPSNGGSGAWFDASAEDDIVGDELAAHFDEKPLAVLRLSQGGDTQIKGAVFVSSERLPGFTSQPVVTVTLSRMVISTALRDLVPSWANFMRGIVELSGCRPTASRENLVRDEAFDRVREHLEERLFEWFERMAKDDVSQLVAIVQWHRYSLAGAALGEPRLRRILAQAYRFRTSAGPLTFGEILSKSEADPILEASADRVIWFHGSQRRQTWIDGLFAGHHAPCVHALRTFEESLLAAFVEDAREAGSRVDLRAARLESEGFDVQLLGARDRGPAPAALTDALEVQGAEVYVARLVGEAPVLGFMAEDAEQREAVGELRTRDVVPEAFQEVIDRRLDERAGRRHEVLLNERSPLVSRALREGPDHPLVSVLRLEIIAALERAGVRADQATLDRAARDRDWIAAALTARRPD